MTPGAVAKEIKAKHTTAKRHLEWLHRFENKVEVIFIKPKWVGYRLR